MSRYTPITSKAEMEPDDGHVFDQVMGVFGRIRGPFSMLLHSPKLTERQLTRANRVEQPVFDALQDRHGMQWLVELTAVANFYVALYGVVNAFDVPVPPGGDRFDG